MSFSSFQEFLSMGGHGLYVWLSYGAALIIVLYNVISVRLGLRRFLQDARDRERRHASRRDSAGAPPHAVATGESNRS